jgi:uncharacterized cupredoxin-like copper-binding protein
MALAAIVLVAPLTIFTGIDRGWFGGDSETENHEGDHVVVELSNWKLVPSMVEVPAGEVTFLAVHIEEGHAHGHGHDEPGTIHDLAVLKKLPDGSYELVGRTPEIKTGDSYELTLQLDSGDYQLVCDIVEEIDGRVVSHMIEGMVAEFRVS